MKRYISIIYKLIIVLLGIFGLMVQIGVYNNNYDFSVLNYFTLISNILCIIYFICSIIYSFIHFNDRIPSFLPRVKGAITMSITVTMIVAAVLLNGVFPNAGLLGLSFISLHILVPIMTILDWYFFDEKGLCKKTDPLLWLIIPIIYYAYIIISVHLGHSFGVDSKYPYSFQDVDKLGYPKVIMINICLILFFTGLGYIFYFIDKHLKK